MSRHVGAPGEAAAALVRELGADPASTSLTALCSGGAPLPAARGSTLALLSAQTQARDPRLWEGSGSGRADVFAGGRTSILGVCWAAAKWQALRKGSAHAAKCQCVCCALINLLKSKP